MLDKEKEVQGVAVYAEFRKLGSTMMVLITPDGYTTTGTTVSATVFRRILTRHTPKRQWRTSAMTWAAINKRDALPITTREQRDEMADERLQWSTALLDGILNGGWEMVAKPILVEVSKVDLDAIASGKTPTKVIYRITQSRTALGYPTEVIAPAPVV